VNENRVARFRANAIRVEESGSIIRDNDFRANARLDCLDTTAGTGTAGTGNTWTNNLGEESDPEGICSTALPSGRRGGRR
jgi:hypothetical protein